MVDLYQTLLRRASTGDPISKDILQSKSEVLEPSGANQGLYRTVLGLLLLAYLIVYLLFSTSKTMHLVHPQKLVEVT